MPQNELKVKQKIEMSFKTYYVNGITCGTDWYGNKGFIPMTGFYTDKIDKETLSENINDSGFGLQSIDGAILSIFSVYEDKEGTSSQKFLKEKRIGTIHDGAEKAFMEGQWAI